MDLHSQMLLEDFISKKPIYEKIREVAYGIIQNIIQKNNFYVVATESRVKHEKSLAGKLELKGKKYSSIYDITDLVGLRIITFYTDEVDKISAFIEKAFNVDWENSVDKRKLYSDENNDRFGYMSLHYIVRIPKEAYFDENMPEVNEIRFEIQMRTALQHVWATAQHDTGYKSDVEVPAKYKREMSQLAGVLELADTAFTKVLNGIFEYRRNVKKLVLDGDYSNLSLDGDTFSSYIAINPFEDLNKKIAGINRAELTESSFTKYLTIFKNLKFKSIADVEQLKKDYSDFAFQLALIQLAETDIDILADTIGIRNLCLTYIYHNGGSVYDLKEFFDTLEGEKASNIKNAERTFSALQKIGVLTNGK